VCDATWHHFINVNLIGVLEGDRFDEFNVPGEDPSKHDGFLSSTAGLAALDQIKNYYTNIGVWISPPPRLACFNRFVWWQLVYADRIMEAALTAPEIPLERIPASTLMFIGIHARDAFGKRASQCQTLQWIIDWAAHWKLIDVRWIDPWDPFTIERFEKHGDGPLPTIDPMPLVDVALGAALVSMRQAFPFAPEKVDAKSDAAALEAAQKGAAYGMQLAVRHAMEQQKMFGDVLMNR
jgi:hypothetical protein